MSLKSEQMSVVDIANKKIELNNGSYLQKMNALLDQFIEILPQNVKTEGVMRISGSSNVIKNTLESYWANPNKKSLKNYNQEDPSQYGIHVLAGMVKQKIRDIQPEPMFSSPEVQSTLKEYEAKMLEPRPMEISALIEKLIAHNAYAEAKFFYSLMYVSRQIADASVDNKMDEENVSIAFLGPNLMPILMPINQNANDPAEIFKKMTLINQSISKSLKEKDPQTDSLFFAKSFEERYPTVAAKYVQELKSLPPKTHFIVEPSKVDSPKKENSSLKHWMKKRIKPLKSVGDMITKWKLQEKFNKYYSLLKDNPKQYSVELLISNPEYRDRVSYQVSEETRKNFINKDNASLVLEDIAMEIDMMMRKASHYTIDQVSITSKRLATIREELDVIKSSLPAKFEHKLIPTQMNFYDLSKQIKKKSLSTTTALKFHEAKVKEGPVELKDEPQNTKNRKNSPS
tara:strand:+ start:4376 stop:5746 length:1371 start_codon:yes stop_codon:yes gene_type:complete